MTFDDVRRLALSLPRVVEGRSYRTPAFRVGKKFLGRLNEDGVTIALRMSFDDRDYLMRAKPKTFFITEHAALRTRVAWRAFSPLGEKVPRSGG